MIGDADENYTYYSYNNEEVQISKVSITLEILPYGLLKMKLNDIIKLK